MKRTKILIPIIDKIKRNLIKVQKNTDKKAVPSIKMKYHPYRDGGDGFIRWVEDNCCLPVYPEGSDIPLWYPANNLPPEYGYLWTEQKEVIKTALKMIMGRFVYNLVVLCWMRGEGKSLLACLIQLWKFFCWPRQNITLGANSKEQTKFVHYDIMRDIILNSPNLLARVGKKNIQEKEIRLKDSKGNTISTIRAISSFSGIVSNITGFTFSEIFDMKNPKFFTQLYGSIRNIPNALGVIDSTVSAKTHILYTIYENWRTGKTTKIFFSHRQSRGAKAEDYWNPNMSQAQLDDYRATMLPSDFAQYFENTWESGGARVFTPDIIKSIFIAGLDGRHVNHSELMEVLKGISDTELSMEDMASKGLDLEYMQKKNLRLRLLEERLWTVDEGYYKFDNGLGNVAIASMDDLDRLSSIFDTDWAILGGGDRADPMKEQLGARTIFTIVAKGLQGSRSNPFMPITSDTKYIYILLGLWALSKHTLDEIKEIIKSVVDDFDGLDKLTVERWGMWDLEPWCNEQNIQFEAVYPSYDKQKSAFTEFFILCRDGRFKSAWVPISGTKIDNILAEEMSVFDHDADKKWFGSPEKRERNGIQDDVMYSISWCIYGGREMSIDVFRPRRKAMSFGFMYQNKELSGSYV